MRRIDARSEVSERLALRLLKDGELQQDEPLDGWTLNLSRGGVRIIVEGRAQIGDEFEVVFSKTETLPRRGRVVWAQEEPDGTILGIEFVATSGTHRSVAPVPPPDDSVVASDDDDDDAK